jgi:hypothetical protein
MLLAFSSRQRCKTSGRSTSIAGLDSAKLLTSTTSFTLVGYRIAPGVKLSGKLTPNTSFDKPMTCDGVIHVSGPAAAPGTLDLSNSTLTGTLGGKPVGP